MVLHDVRYGLRLLVRKPGFAVIAVVTLALGIGANTAIFTVIDRVILRAVPFPSPQRLAVLWETNPSLPVPVMVASPPTLHDWLTRNRSFEHIGAFRWQNVTLGGNEPEQVRGATVSAGLLRALGVQPRIGRLFLEEEDRPNGRRVVLISDPLWRRRFGASPAVPGQSISIDGIPTEIVGVMPPGYAAPPPVVFRGQPPADRAELWIPLAIDLAGGQRGAHNLTVVGRLRPGVTIEAADQDLKRVMREVGREIPSYAEWSARVVPLSGWVTESARRAMTLLGAAVGFVLLLACANVANLLLARGVGRRREFAIRTALGAGRRRLATQVIAEATVLAIVGGVAGVALASALVRLVVTLGPSTIPGVREAALDPRAILVAALLSLASAVLAAAVPALRVMSARVQDWLGDRSGGTAAGTIRLQKSLVVVQVGLAVALLVTAALLVENFRLLRQVDPGFSPSRVATGKIVLPPSRYPDGASRAAFIARLLSAARRVPGLVDVGLADAVPMADNRQGTSFSRVDAPTGDAAAKGRANFAYATEGFFEALGIRLIRGRTFLERDAAGSPRVVIINERLARQTFGADDPLGRLVTVGVSSQSPLEVIGVVGDDRHLGVDTDPTPTFFVPYRQLPAMRELAVIARGSADSTPLVNGLRAVVRSLDGEMPLYQVRTMEQVVDASVATPRSLAWLLGGFAFAGLLLAAIGVFGVLSHAVSQRTREFGVRIAIGARPHQLLGMVVGEGMLQVGLGVIAGVVLAIASSRLLSGLLFGVTATSPIPYVVVTVVLVVVALVACVSPAQRAMRTDPVTALRAD